jgi:hypothetical protein
MVEPPEAVRQSFLDAGWFLGRSVPVAASVPRDHPAWAVLAVFGGLTILEREPEPDPNWPPKEELVFRALYPCPPVTDVWGGLLGSRLVGIADVHNAHAELYLAADGRCFESHCIGHPAFYYRGASLADAVEGLLLGRRARPMLKPDQESVSLYGEQFTADSPGLYRYR